MNFAHKCNSMQVKHGSFTWSSLIFFFLRKPQIRQISLSSSLFIPCWMRMNYDLLLQIFEYLMLPLLLRLTAHSIHIISSFATLTEVKVLWVYLIYNWFIKHCTLGHKFSNPELKGYISNFFVSSPKVCNSIC